MDNVLNFPVFQKFSVIVSVTFYKCRVEGNTIRVGNEDSAIYLFGYKLGRV